MSNEAARLLNDVRREQEQTRNLAPAVDEILLFALERRYLGIGAFRDIVLEQKDYLENLPLVDWLRDRVRLIQIDEICFERKDRFHLPVVESVLSSMRDCGHSLVFLVSGEPRGARLYVGLSQFLEEPRVSLSSAADGYRAAWAGHFPGSRFRPLMNEEVVDLSYSISGGTRCGVLTGIPSLKRQEETAVFVQGIERMVRVLRGKSYTWLSVADPIGPNQIDQALDACRQLRSDIHHLVRVNLSKGVSKGKTVMLGMFGMMGTGETDGSSESVAKSISKTHAKVIQEGTSEQYLGGVGGITTGASLGAVVGSVVPGVGTAIGACVGAVGGFLLGTGSQLLRAVTTDSVSMSDVVNKGLGAMFTGDSRSVSTSDALTTTTATTHAVSNAVAQQLAGGGFGSFGLSWTKTTTVTQELLNRKAEYCEELLSKHEDRLQQGSALGMWNVGHYFCANDGDSFSLGQAAVRSLFSGMDSHFEPPRIIEMPEGFSTVLRRFANLYISFPNEELRGLFKKERPREKGLVVATHPLGFLFNGVGTPLNTRELAIATPIARQDIEGISVTERAAFGVNLESSSSAPGLRVGTVQDRGEATHQSYCLTIDNLPKHLGVFGLTGSGKTNTVCNLLEQLWKVHRIPFMVIEPAKAEYRALTNSEALCNDLIVITAGVGRSESCPLRLNPFEFDPGRDADAGRVHVLTHIDRLKATFNASFPMYASMPYILEEAILEVYRERGWDLGHSNNRFVDIYAEEFYDYVPTLRDLYCKIDTIVRRKGYWIEQQMNIEAALKARLSSLMVGAKDRMLNCRRSLPSSELFDRPVVVELKHLGDDDEKAFLMGLLVSKLYEYREATCQHTGAGHKLCHMLVVEEAHRLLKNLPEGSDNLESANIKSKAVTSFVDMLAEIRAFGQGVIAVDQVPSRLNSNVIKGTAAKIVHRILAEDDRQMVGKCMGLNDDQIADLALLDTGQCVVHQDGQRKAFQCKADLNITNQTLRDGSLGAATEQFKALHCLILDPLASVFGARPCLQTDAVDGEDYLFYDGLHKVMLAAAFSNPMETEKALGSLQPTRYAIRDSEWARSNSVAWMHPYWTQITDEAWAFYSGEFREFLKYRSTGWELLQAWCESESIGTALPRYGAAVAGYMGLPRASIGTASRNPVANAYDQLLTKSEAIVAIRDRFKSPASAESQGQGFEKIVTALETQLESLLPRDPFVPSDLLLLGILEALYCRLRWPQPLQTAVTARILSKRERSFYNA